MIEKNEHYLITTESYFYGIDGEQYRAVWGKCKILITDDWDLSGLPKQIFESDPRRYTNWFVKVGEGEGSIIITGCQVNYVIKTTKKPKIIKGIYQEGKMKGRPINSILIIE